MDFRYRPLIIFLLFVEYACANDLGTLPGPSFDKFYTSYSVFFWSFLVLVISLFSALSISITYIKRKNQLEKKIKRLNLELEQRVTLRTQQLKEQQSRVAQASKLASLGEMAAGVAHEINNPLTIIRMLTSKVKRYERSDEIDSLVERIDDQVTRITDIVVGMKNISRDGEGLPLQKFSFNDVLRDTKNLCRNRFHNEGIALEVGEIDERIRCMGVPVQISQVLLNLLNNAFDAIRENASSLDRPWIKVTPLLQDCYLRVDVEDSGIGIDPAIVDKILDPFYTTKEYGKGTGLSLSVSRRIMESHEGELFLDSSKANTCFSILIPRVADKDQDKKNGPTKRTIPLNN